MARHLQRAHGAVEGRPEFAIAIRGEPLCSRGLHARERGSDDGGGLEVVVRRAVAQARGLTESLAQEVAGFGIKVTLVEPGGFATDWNGASATVADALPEYAPLHDAMAQNMAGTQPQPIGFGSAILKVVDAEKAPLRVFFGERPTQIAPHIYQQRLAEWSEWAPSHARPKASRTPRWPSSSLQGATDSSVTVASDTFPGVEIMTVTGPEPVRRTTTSAAPSYVG